MSVKAIEALMTGLVVLACAIGGIILLAAEIDRTVGIVMVAIVGSYLGLDLAPWIPLGRIRSIKGDKPVD